MTSAFSSSDRLEIHELTARYAWSLDTGDEDAFVECFCRAGARARSYVAVAMHRTDGPHLLNVMGYYDDELERENGRWLFSRRYIRDWSGPVLARFAGQDGARSARQLPDALAGLWATQG